MPCTFRNPGIHHAVMLLSAVLVLAFSHHASWSLALLGGVWAAVLVAVDLGDREAATKTVVLVTAAYLTVLGLILVACGGLIVLFALLQGNGYAAHGAPHLAPILMLAPPPLFVWAAMLVIYGLPVSGCSPAGHAHAYPGTGAERGGSRR